ncbi:hypothetical protein BC332_00761 [Capsicum chinense]|nr:hypothetical protein BC332_00761 [Capsicum chinense]
METKCYNSGGSGVVSRWISPPTTPARQPWRCGCIGSEGRRVNEFERKKQEMLAAQSASAVDRETNSAGQPAQVKWISRCNLLMERIKEDSKVLAPWLQNERHKNKRMRKELDLLMKHVYKKSSSNDERSSQEDNQTYEDESDDDFDNVNESDFNPGNVNESDFVPDGHSPHGSWAAMIGIVSGALASVGNTIEHGGQVGMERRENSEVFGH